MIVSIDTETSIEWQDAADFHIERIRKGKVCYFLATVESCIEYCLIC